MSALIASSEPPTGNYVPSPLTTYHEDDERNDADGRWGKVDAR